METFDWLDAELVGIVIAAVASIVAAIFKVSLTPGKYAGLAPRAAALYKLFVALLPDLIKMARAVRQLKSGESDAEIREPKHEPPNLTVVK